MSVLKQWATEKDFLDRNSSYNTQVRQNCENLNRLLLKWNFLDKMHKITKSALSIFWVRQRILLVRKGIVLQPAELPKPGHGLQGAGVKESTELEMHQQLAKGPWQWALGSTYTAREQQLSLITEPTLHTQQLLEPALIPLQLHSKQSAITQQWATPLPL